MVRRRREAWRAAELHTSRTASVLAFTGGADRDARHPVVAPDVRLGVGLGGPSGVGRAKDRQRLSRDRIAWVLDTSKLDTYALPIGACRTDGRVG